MNVSFTIFPLIIFHIPFGSEGHVTHHTTCLELKIDFHGWLEEQSRAMNFLDVEEERAKLIIHECSKTTPY